MNVLAIHLYLTIRYINLSFHQYVGIGWVPVRDATPEDENLPQVFSPHCSQCKHYDVLKDKKMYCFKSHKCITARKRPCKDYSEQ